jgi:hypothetical protein
MKRLLLLIIVVVIFSGCTTTRVISRYVSDTRDSVQQLILYEKSMTFELLFLRKTIYVPRASLLYFYGYYVITDDEEIVFYIYAKDPRLLGFLENTDSRERKTGGPVVQRYRIELFNPKMIRLHTKLIAPLFHLFFGPIENGKPPTIFTEV